MKLTSILRGIAAILAGVVIGAVLSIITDTIFEKAGLVPSIADQMANGSPTWFLIAGIIYRSLYTVLSGYIGAWIAPSHPMRYALALGCIALAANFAGTVAMWSYGQNWYPIILTIFALPCAWWGGELYLKHKMHA